ncbi:MAG: hypothetical protein Ct9H300mP12_08280 [Acidimicrobiales bacterium]|nr:MAG: hypothetical protein Ct9H300mP12_08280 [Acidimicrobiales bacterium]
MIGARAVDLFPKELANRYEEQDHRVFAEGEPLRDELELIRRPDGRTGWYLTTKLPVGRAGAVVGLVSVAGTWKLQARGHRRGVSRTGGGPGARAAQRRTEGS